jgi:hypothetical protein
MDESLEDRPSMPAGCPEAMTTQPPTFDSDLHTVLPMPIDIHTDKTQAPATTGVHEEGFPAPAMVEDSPMSTSAPPINETQAPATTGVHEEGVPAPAMVEESPMSTSAPPTDVPLTEDLPQSANGPAPKKRKVAARAIVSNSISDK